MSTLQQALQSVGLIKPQLPVYTKHEQKFETECAVLGINNLGNKQYFLDGEEVCGCCLERYKNKLLGVDCDLCQIEQVAMSC